MKTLLLIVFILAVAVASHQQTRAQKVQPSDITEITLNTGDGFFDCGREMTLRADGAVKWQKAAAKTENQTAVKSDSPSAITPNDVSIAQTKTNQPRTVTDFYLQLPSSFVNDTETVAKRRARIEIEDAANGYLKLKPTFDQNPGEYTEIVLFKRSAGGYVVGISTVQCTMTCSSYERFLERRANRWTDVEARIFPVARETELRLYQIKKTAAHQNHGTDSTFSTRTELPRRGRTVRVKYASEGADKEFELYSLTWNGEQFAPDAPLPPGGSAPKLISDKVLLAAEAAWKPFFERVKIAVKKRDRKTLRGLMSEDFSYNCCDQGYPDNRSGAFTIWDGNPKDFAGWKNLDRVLRVETMVEGISGANRPIRFFDDAAFEFAANNRWIFIGYGASRM